MDQKSFTIILIFDLLVKDMAEFVWNFFETQRQNDYW